MPFRISDNVPDKVSDNVLDNVSDNASDKADKASQEKITLLICLCEACFTVGSGLLSDTRAAYVFNI